MKRLFAFGCSFTRYWWPTWVLAIDENFDETQNWALPGGSNPFIATSVTEANQRHKFTKDDTVIIMWTSVARDAFYNDIWFLVGNVYDPNPPFNIPQDDRWSLRGYTMRDLAAVSSTRALLENIGCNFIFTSMIGLDEDPSNIPINVPMARHFNIDSEKFRIEDTDDIMDLYKDDLSIFRRSTYDVIYDQDFLSKPLPNGNSRHDLHPRPDEAGKFAEIVLPEFPISSAKWDILHDATASIDEFYSQQDIGERMRGTDENPTILQRYLELLRTGPERF